MKIKFIKIDVPLTGILKKFHDIYKTWYTWAETSEPTHFAQVENSDEWVFVYTHGSYNQKIIARHYDTVPFDRLILVGRLHDIDVNGASEYETRASNLELEEEGIQAFTQSV